jgi:excisionase family DNA binding protein
MGEGNGAGMKPPWTVKQFADELCISRATVDSIRRSGALPSYTKGRTRLFRDEDVQAYIRLYYHHGLHSKAMAAWAKEVEP